MTAAATHAFAPDYVSAPGETLREVISGKSINQAELAARTGYSAKHVNQILQGTAPITPETAMILERVTGLEAGFWNRREADYREAILRSRPVVMDAADEQWLDSLPVRELKKRGNLPNVRDRGQLFNAALAFFGVADRAAYDRLWSETSPAFRQSQAFASDPAAVSAWLRVAQLDAEHVEAEPYSSAAFQKELRLVKELTANGDPNRIKTMCAKAGVVVVFVREFPSSRISGAAWWAAPARAVIALSDRYKKDDFFWFAFFHEAAHVLLHSKRETFVDGGGKNSTRREAEADGWASDFLIPPETVAELRTLRSEAAIRNFARDLGIAPSIVVGRMQHDHLLGYNQGNTLRRHIEIIETE